MYKTIGLIILFLTQVQGIINAQNKDLDRKTFLSGFHVSVSGYSGLTKFDFDSPKIISLKSPLLTQNSATLEIQYYIKKGIYISTSIGYLVTTQKNHTKYDDKEWYNYRDGLAWLGYKEFGIGLGYSKFLSTKLILRPQLRFGGLHSRQRYPLFRYQDGSELQPISKVHPFILAQVNIGYILKNNNLLNLGMYYRHSFSNLYSGFYFDIPESTAFSGKGTELGLNIGYSFTGYNRRINQSIKDKDQYLKAFRHLGDKARLLEVSVDFFSFLNKNNDPEGIVVNSLSKQYGIRVEAEFGIKENTFWETGLHLGEYYTGYIILNENKDANTIESQRGPEYQVALNLGYGKRIRTSKNISIVTLSGGLAINGTLTGSTGSTYLFSNTTNEYLYRIDYEDEKKIRIYPSLYANLNRDFQITQKMFLSLNYRYNQGLINSAVREYEVETYGSSIRNFDGVRNGTSHAIGLGLKFNFGEKKTQENTR